MAIVTAPGVTAAIDDLRSALGDKVSTGASIREQHGVDACTAAREQCTGEQRVAAVVPAPDEQDDARAVDVVERAGREGGDRRRGPLHQRAAGEQRTGRDLRATDRVDVVGDAHDQPSATTTADAMPAEMPACGSVAHAIWQTTSIRLIRSSTG